MRNLRMKEAIDNGTCLNIRSVGSPVDGEPGVFELRQYVDGIDYADPEMEDWIWSIGRRLNDGKFFAATDARFYQNADYECLWLR